MELWIKWLALVNEFQPACSRQRTFFWLVIVLIGFTLKLDFLGVTSLARGAGLLPNYYTSLLHFFVSTAVDLPRLQKIWLNVVLNRFSGIVRINGRCVIVGDGIKIGKEGKKMPGVKWLHQDSESNSKAEYIMGHSLQAIGLLANGLSGYLAIPLAAQIHEGIRFSFHDKRTLLDKMSELLVSLKMTEHFYFVADKYYCSGRLLKQLLASGIDLITMMKKNAVAYYPPDASDRKQFGRPPKYGKRVKLFDLFKTELPFITAPMPGQPKVIIEYCVKQLFWKPAGQLVSFVFVRHPTRGLAIVMSTDLALPALDMIMIYSLRFKIEVLFKQAIHQFGTFMYRFWLKIMAPNKRGSGDKNLHFEPKVVKEKVKQKLHAYHLFILLGLIAQGLTQYLAIHYPALVWKNFGSWLRTIRDNIVPSEKVVAMALSRTYLDFLLAGHFCDIFKKFITKRIDIRLIQHASLNDPPDLAA